MFVNRLSMSYSFINMVYQKCDFCATCVFCFYIICGFIQMSSAYVFFCAFNVVLPKYDLV